MTTTTINKPSTGHPRPAPGVVDPVGAMVAVPGPGVPGATGPATDPASPPVLDERSLRIDRIKLRAPSGSR